MEAHHGNGQSPSSILLDSEERGTEFNHQKQISVWSLRCSVLLLEDDSADYGCRFGLSVCWEGEVTTVLLRGLAILPFEYKGINIYPIRGGLLFVWRCPRWTLLPKNNQSIVLHIERYGTFWESQN
eukprot:4241115-Amphidinium_carterae.1